MAPKHRNRVTRPVRPMSVASLSDPCTLNWGKWVRRAACGALGCLLLAGCSLFGGSKQSQSNLSPSYRASAQQVAVAKKTQKQSGSSWLPSWLRPKETPPPKMGVGEWLDQPQSKWGVDEPAQARSSSR